MKKRVFLVLFGFCLQGSSCLYAVPPAVPGVVQACSGGIMSGQLSAAELSACTESCGEASLTNPSVVVPCMLCCAFFLFTQQPESRQTCGRRVGSCLPATQAPPTVHMDEKRI